MKVVDEESQLENLYLAAKSEAKKFFNNDELYMKSILKTDILKFKLCLVK